MKILKAIQRQLDQFIEETAHAIDEGRWGIAGGHVLILLLIFVICLIAACSVVLIFWYVIKGFLGKILFTVIGIPGVLYILYLSFLANRETANQAANRSEEKNHLEVWAEEVYDYVRDAMFLVFRAVSEYTAIVMPSTPGAVELPNCISIRDGYAVFNFFARVREPVDTEQIRRDLSRTMTQMLRAHELKGIPSDLVQIGSAHYSPLQILSVTDYGDSITVSVVFTNEKTVEVTKARRLLKLDSKRKQELKKPEDLYDDIRP